MNNLTPSQRKEIRKQQEEAEIAVFWNEIEQHLPKSLEMSALGNEKIFRAFSITYPKIKQFFDQELAKREEEIKQDYIKYIIARVYSKQYEGATPFGRWKNLAEVEDMKTWQ